MSPTTNNVVVTMPLGNVKLAYTSGPSLYVDTPLCFVCPTNIGVITEVPLVKPFRHGGRVEGALGDEFTTAWAGQRMGVTTVCAVTGSPRRTHLLLLVVVLRHTSSIRRRFPGVSLWQALARGGYAKPRDQ